MPCGFSGKTQSMQKAITRGIQLGLIVLFATTLFVAGQRYLVQNKAFSASEVISTQTDWNAGSYNGTENYSTPGTLTLRDNGTWSNATIRTPDQLLNDGTAITADNSSIYLMASNDIYFAQYQPEEDVWKQRTNAPYTARPGSDMVYLDGYVYAVFGGYQKNFARYSVATDTWENLPNVLDYLYQGASLATDGTSIYLLRGTNTTDFWKYDLTADEWQPLSSAPASINYGADMVFYDGKLYATRGNNQTHFYEYDIAANSWSSLAAVSAPLRDSHNIAQADGYIYVNQGYNTASMFRYNIATNTWTTLADTPQTNRYVGVVYVPDTDLLYVFRGNNTRDIWAYNPDTGEYLDYAFLPTTPNTGADLVYNSGYLYMPRGANQTTMYRYDQILDTWEQLANAPDRFNYDVKGVAAGSKLYFFRGTGSSFWEYDPGTDGWTTLASAPLTTSQGAALIYPGSGDYLYATRGANTGTVWRYSISTDTWDPDGDVADLPGTHRVYYGSRLLTDGTNVYIFTSGTGPASLLKYTIASDEWTVLSSLPFVPYLGSDAVYHSGKIYAQAGNYSNDYWEYTLATNTWRRLSSLQPNGPYQLGPYSGGSLEVDGSGTLFSLHGNNSQSLNSYTPSAQSYISSGTWTSNTLDLTYVTSWTSLSATSTTPGDSSVAFETRSSTDGVSWSSWQAVSGGTIASPARRYLQVRATLNATTDQSQAPSIDSLTISYVKDETAPTNPSSFTGMSRKISGSALIDTNTYSHAHPYFSWTGASDADTGVSGYYVYFGTNASADPEASGTFTTIAAYEVTHELSNATYYLRIKTKDGAGNVSAAVTGFTYVYQGAQVQTTTYTSSSDFSGASLTNTSTTGDVISLSSKNGFWQQRRLSYAPAGMSYGSRFAYVSSSNTLYTFQGNNSSGFHAYSVATDTWTTLASAPSGVRYGGFVVEGPAGFLYGMGGNDTTGWWQYDIANDVWSDEAAVDPPSTVSYGASGVYDGQRYIYVTRGNNDDAFWRYDTVEDSWSVLANATFEVNTQIYRGSDLAYDGSDTIFALQGNVRSGISSYSISEDTWTIMPTLPHVSYYGASLEYDSSSQKLYYIPGYDSPYFFVFDIASQTWSQLENAPSTLYYGADIRLVGSQLFVLRGRGTSVLYVYDVEKATWFLPNRGFFSTVFEGTSYESFYYGSHVVAGNDSLLYLTRGNYSGNIVSYNTQTGEVIQLPSVPAAVYTGASLEYNDTEEALYATTNSGDSDFYKYDIANKQWSTITTDPLPTTPSNGASLAYDGSRYIYYVRGGNSTLFYRYDTQASAGARWSQLSNSPGGLNYGSDLIYRDGYIYTQRGANADPNPLYRYNPSDDTWTTLASLSDDVYNDALLVSGAGEYLYSCKGENESLCYRYSIAGDSWESIADMPGQLYQGAEGDTFGDGIIYVIPGNGTNTDRDGLYTYVEQTNSTSFEESGTYTSATHDLGSVYRFANLSLTYTAAANATVAVETRTSADDNTWEDWADATLIYSNGTENQYKINSSEAQYIQVRFTFTSGDGVYSGVISDYSVSIYQDTDAPSNPETDGFAAYDASTEGLQLTTNGWYPYTEPYFTWPSEDEVYGADDTVTGSGIAGYYVYFGTNVSANPETDGVYQTTTSYEASSLTSGETYYLRIKTKDNAGNTQSVAWQPFIYKFDSSAPSQPANLSADPSGYSATDSFDFSWDVVTDPSGTVSYCYKTGASSGAYSTDQCSTATTVTGIPSYRTGSNTFFLRTKDVAGNYSEYTTVTYYFSSEAPAPPSNLTVTPAVSTENSFAFSWDPPSSFFGSEESLRYYYSINALPSVATVTETANTALSEGPFATLPGRNVFYIVTKDEAGNIDYDLYDSVTFEANTTAPGIPTSIDIADVSVKATESWKLAISWEEPSDLGAGVASYKIFRSTDGVTYTALASTSGISYVDTNLDQVTYYYKVKACDSANNCGAFSSEVELFPDGKFTEPAPLVADPSVTEITTKQATVSWSTSRTADSKIAYGTAPGEYFTEEVSNSEQVTSHQLVLNNLNPGTTYYFIAKWTDEDGNTGTSDEFSFETAPPPSVKDVEIDSVGIESAILKFTTTGASSAQIYFGESTAFGGVQEISTSTSESTYTVQLSGLLDGTKYYFKINTYDAEDNEYDGTILDFETLPRPRISNVQVQQVSGTAQPVVLVSWLSNTPISSIVTFYPTAAPSLARDEISIELTSGRHRILLKGLDSNTAYTLQAKGLDRAGNEAVSELIPFTTATDTRPPLITNLSIEGTNVPSTAGIGEEMRSQLIVSWKTDEPSTSQIEFGEGTGSNYAQRTQEDTSLTTDHLVVLSNLTPSKVYHLRALSKDVAGNEGASVDTVTITPKATDNALDLVVTNLRQVFGLVGN